jgi:putative ABC transport system permease protein
VIGFVLAAPVSYFAMERWLATFPYHVDLGPGLFLWAGLVAVGIALSTVGYQALRAARANPAASLKYE